MLLDPHMKALADVLVGICVRELTARSARKEKPSLLRGAADSLPTNKESYWQWKTYYNGKTEKQRNTPAAEAAAQQ